MTVDTDIEKNREIGEKHKRHLIVGMVGPTGAGKSTLGQELAKRWGVNIVEERFGENPFLEKFYEDPREYSFKSQLWFLEQKTLQLAGLDTSKVNIIDPSLEMDLLYAETHRRLGWMAENEWGRYKMAFTTFRSRHGIILPDISVVVNAKLEVLEKRIRERGRPYELLMLNRFPEYFTKLSEAVAEWTNKPYPPKILFNAGYYDFTSNGAHKEEVLGRIEGVTVTHISMNRMKSDIQIILPLFPR